MNFYGIIPSRFQSSRFPGKPLVDLKGKSMIQRVYENTKKCSLLKEVIVATDDGRIYKHVKDFGGNVMMTKEQHPSGTDRCEEVAKNFDNKSVIINIQGDEPLISPTQIEQICKIFIEKPNTQIASLCKPFQNIAEVMNPNRIKVVLNADEKALYFSRSVIPYNKIIKPTEYMRHIGIYAYKKDVLTKITQLPISFLEKKESLEQLRWIYHGFEIQMGITSISSPNIDSPDDIDEVLKLIN